MMDPRTTPTGSSRMRGIGNRRTPYGGDTNNGNGSAEIVFYYVIFGIGWIFFSDMLLTQFVSSPAVYGEISIIKGWLFIAVTALLLHVLIKRRMRMLSLLQQQHNDESREHERRIMYSNRLYAVLSAVNKSVIRISAQHELLDEICRIMVDVGGFKFAWIGWPDKDGWVVPASYSRDESGYLATIRISVCEIPEGQGPTGTAIRERRAVVCDNIASNPAMRVWHDVALHNGFASSACFPFALSDGSTAGLTIYSAEPDFFCTDEIRLLCDVADDLGYALHSLHTAAAHRLAEEEIRQLAGNLEERVEQRTAELAAVNQELEAFSYSVSHDLRAPLRAIDGFSLALLEDCHDLLDDFGKDYLKRVRNASQRMATLIDDILQLSRVNRYEIRPFVVDLSRMAHEIAAELTPLAADRSVSWEIEEGLIAHGDEGLLKIALRNLLENAFKYTAHTKQAIIGFGRGTHNGKPCFCISDNGAGFDMAYTDKLFNPFQRLHGDDEFSGTGIGLAIVQRIIHRHGGDVAAEGSVGHGARFYFYLQERNS